MATLEGFSIPFFPSIVNILTWVATFLCTESSNNYPEVKLLVRCARIIKLPPKDLFIEHLKFYQKLHQKILLYVNPVRLESMAIKRNLRKCLINDRP